MVTQNFISTIDGQDTSVRVRATGPGRYRVEVDGIEHEVDARRLAGGTWSLIVDDDSFDVELEVGGESEAKGAYNALVRGRVIALLMRDERRVRLEGASARVELKGPQQVRAPMPGKVVKILAKLDQEITLGEAVVVIEAMKMENHIASPKAGRIVRIAVEEGQAVETGADLLTVE